MPLKFIFVRHGEAEHNVAFHNPEIGKKAFTTIRDPPLTPTGFEQAKEVANTLCKIVQGRNLDIWCSPLQRCIQTAEEIYEEVSAQTIYYHDSLLERLGGGHICNERPLKYKLPEQWDKEFLPALPPHWTERENQTALTYRLQGFALLLTKIYEKEVEAVEDSYVICVSHADAIFAITGKTLKNTEYVVLTMEDINSYVSSRKKPQNGFESLHNGDAFTDTSCVQQESTTDSTNSS
jgi:broad specificity phosphatase PhoE